MTGKKQDNSHEHSGLSSLLRRATQQAKRLVRERLPRLSNPKGAANTYREVWSEDLLPTWQAGSNAALEFDRKENAEPTPSDDEHIALRCVWAVEFYPPSYVNKLLDSFQKLGWDKRDDPHAWVNNTRRYFDGSGSFNLGTIATAEKSGTPLAGGRTAPLPPGVDYAVGHLHRITPSLICIVMCFVFNAPFRDEFDQILRTAKKTFKMRLPYPLEFRISTPRVQKIEEISRIRDESVRLAANWFRAQLPGVFSSGLLDNELPTCELVTLRRAEPFPKRDGETPQAPGYLSVLRLDSSRDLWRGKEHPDMKFTPFVNSDNRLDYWERERIRRYHSTLAVREGWAYRAARDWSESDTLYTDSVVGSMIAFQATLHLLEGYSQKRNEFRDTLAVRGKHRLRNRSSQTMRTLVDNVAHAVDIGPVTTDLISSTREPSTFCRDVAVFDSVHTWMPETTLGEALNSAINGRATELNQAERSLRDYLTQYGSLLAATENVRTQKTVKRLTYVVVALAGITFITSDAALISLDWIQDRWGEFMAAISAALI